MIIKLGAQKQVGPPLFFLSDFPYKKALKNFSAGNNDPKNKK